MSGGSSGPSTTTTISKSEPPEYVKPYSIEMMNRAGELSNRPFQTYGGQRIADMTPYQMMGLDMTAQRALSGSPVMNAAQGSLQNTLAGGYMSPDSNPYMASMASAIGDQFNRTVGAQNASLMRTQGAFGNTGLSEKMSMDNGQLAGQLTNLYGQNYSAERQRQMQAAQLSPQMAAADYQDAQNLIGAGDAYRTYHQDLLNQGFADWQAAQNGPYQQLDVLANAIRTSMGGGGTSTSTAPNPYQGSRMASMIGGGLAGYGIGQMQGWNPYMSAGLGAVGGGLLM